MIELNVVLLILFTHWIADFVCQTDQMAVNKSKSNYWLYIHVIIYTWWMFALAFLFLFDDIKTVLMWTGANMVLHWVTDFWTSRINSWLWQRERRHDFFVMVGLDQLIHYMCLLALYQDLKI